MNRKITLRALGAKCGALGASGLANGVTPSAATACDARKPSSPSSAASATAVKPPPASQRNSRRVRPQKLRAIASTPLSRKRLVQVDELVEVQRQQAEPPQRFLGR